MKLFVQSMLVVAGVIHLLPLGGVLGADRIAALYSVALDDNNLEILMRHRAVLFGLLGAFLVLAAFRPALQVTAIVAGVVSAGSFVAIALASGEDYNDAIARVVLADVVALIGLAAAGAALLFLTYSPAHPSLGR